MARVLRAALLAAAAATAAGLAGLAASTPTTATAACWDDLRPPQLAWTANATAPTPADSADTAADPGRWNLTVHDPALASAPCTIPRHSGPISEETFQALYATTQPVILTSLTDNAEFVGRCQKDRLLADWACLLQYGDKVVVLSTANTFSYTKGRMTLREYVATQMGPTDPYAPADDIWYHFGDNDHAGWADLFATYVRPPLLDAAVRGSISFGMGGSGSGVPFHTHGPVFAEVLHGLKRWFLYPPAATPNFSPVATSLSWVYDVYPQLPPSEMPMECVLGPGEVLYLPHGWWHATLNLGESVFISVFV